MATREELLALLSSRRRGLSIRPPTQEHSQPWQQWLADDSRLKAATGPQLSGLIDTLAARPLLPAPSAVAAAGRWRQMRALFRQGWGDEREEPRGLRYGGFSASVLFNLFFAVMLVWLTYLRFMAQQAPGEETVRIRITGFGTPQTPGGGGEAAAGDLQAASAGSRPAAASTASPTSAAAVTPAAAAASAEPAPVSQPLQVSQDTVPEQSEFQLPPPREVAVDIPSQVPLRNVPVPTEAPIPEALPEVRPLALPTRTQMVIVADAKPDVRELPTVPEPMPEVRLRELQPRAPGSALSVPALASGRALPTVRAEGDADADNAGRAVGSGVRAANAPVPGLPGATGQAPAPGRNAVGTGAGPATRNASGGWPSPRRDDDWGVGERSRAGAASGGERGNPRGQGGSGLFNADGSPRLANDSFKPRFPDPYKEGTWLKRPTLGYRGTMFDGIWRPPGTLLDEWVRAGVKSFDIPLPGGKVRIRCVVSILQAGGGCLPVAGKEGVHDQPATARPPPAVPFKPHLVENPADLSTPAPAPDAPGDAGSVPATQP